MSQDDWAQVLSRPVLPPVDDSNAALKQLQEVAEQLKVAEGKLDELQPFRVDEKHKVFRVRDRHAPATGALQDEQGAYHSAVSMHPSFGALVDEVARLRAKHELALATYVEAARERDAKAAASLANAQADAARETKDSTKAIKVLTFVLAGAAVIQAIAACIQACGALRPAAPPSVNIPPWPTLPACPMLPPVVVTVPSPVGSGHTPVAPDHS